MANRPLLTKRMEYFMNDDGLINTIIAKRNFSCSRIVIIWSANPWETPEVMVKNYEYKGSLKNWNIPIIVFTSSVNAQGPEYETKRSESQASEKPLVVYIRSTNSSEDISILDKKWINSSATTSFHLKLYLNFKRNLPSSFVEFDPVFVIGALWIAESQTRSFFNVFQRFLNFLTLWKWRKILWHKKLGCEEKLATLSNTHVCSLAS